MDEITKARERDRQALLLGVKLDHLPNLSREVFDATEDICAAGSLAYFAALMLFGGEWDKLWARKKLKGFAAAGRRELLKREALAMAPEFKHDQITEV